MKIKIILPKILRLLESSISVNVMKLKCLNSLAEIGFLPPPGGPIAQQKLTSTKLRKSPVNKEKC
jgi:hypothetical protein